MKLVRFTILIFLLSSLNLTCQNRIDADNQAFRTNAKSYLPDFQARASLMENLEERIQNVTADMAIYRSYRSSGSYYHTAIMNSWVHGLRANAGFASDLLDSGDSTHQALGFRVWEAVISYQDQDTASRTYGIWPYYAEEPFEQMNAPDWNWADFIGVELLESYLRHYDIIPDGLKQQMAEAIVHASRSIMKRDVKPGYTNIAIMGTLVTHLAGRLFDKPELREYSDMRLKRFYDYTIDLQGFQEYNSPTYTVVALNELQRMKQYLLDQAALEMVDYCYRLAWEELAGHFHTSTAQLGGPHSRSYSTLLGQRFYDLLYSASEGRINYHDASQNIAYYKLQHEIPEDLVPAFLESGPERTRIDTFSIGQHPVIGTTWLHPQACFGSANKSTTWQQRRPWLIYWGDDTNPKYLRVKLLHDYVDFGVGNIFTVQDRNKALTGLNFATDGGDYHLLLDRISDGQFRASDLRLRFEASPANLFENLHQHDNQISLDDEPVKIQVDMLQAIFGNHQIVIEKGRDEDHCWIDWIIYQGKEQDFDLTSIRKAVFAWSTCILTDPGDLDSCPTTQSEISDRTLSLALDDLKLSITVVPAKERALQHDKIHPLDQ